MGKKDASTATPERATKPTLQQRSARTRSQLLTATLQSLVEGGYGATTTNEVCRRAGVTRGTMLHHFPSRAALMAEAAYFVFERDFAQVHDQLAAVPALERSPEQLIDLVFAGIQTPTFYAWLELLVAARTDAELRGHVTAVQRRMQGVFEEGFAALFPEGVPPLRLHDGSDLLEGQGSMHFLLAVLNWLAVDRITLAADDPLIRSRVDALKRMARAQFGAWGPPER